MNDHGILKLTANEKTRSMHYTHLNGELVVLTLSDSNKINDIKENNEVQLDFTKTDEVVCAKAEIVDDKEIVKNVFNQMLDENSTHFKTFDEKIVLLRLCI